jgi:predicted transglutaminase-like cysteine proteinase
MPRRNREPQYGPYNAWEQLWQMFCPWVTGTDEIVIEKPLRTKRAALSRIKAKLMSVAIAAVCLTSLSIAPVQAANPVDANLVQISLQQQPQALLQHYPLLFGKTEKRYENLAPFTKWAGALSRFAEQLPDSLKYKQTRKWLSFLENTRDLPPHEQVEAVNHYMNKFKFISDVDNYKVSDYWATPMEFMRRGGDCEDYAFAKYVSLRALGFKEEQLRIAIVFDTQLQMPHAVLVVYQDDEALVLDNQAEDVKSAGNIPQYAPIYSINQYAWWRH